MSSGYSTLTVFSTSTGAGSHLRQPGHWTHSLPCLGHARSAQCPALWSHPTQIKWSRESTALHWLCAPWLTVHPLLCPMLQEPETTLSGSISTPPPTAPPGGVGQTAVSSTMPHLVPPTRRHWDWSNSDLPHTQSSCTIPDGAPCWGRLGLELFPLMPVSTRVF